MAVVIDGGNRSAWRKPTTCRKLLTNLITYKVKLAHVGFEEKTEKLNNIMRRDGQG
jgi:hypothetical protein